MRSPRRDLASETPFATIDLGRVRSNLERVKSYIHAHGLRWRPHVKTHKSPVLARLQLEAGAHGLTVATPREAEVMAQVSDDLLLAHPPVGPKAARIMTLPSRVHLKVAIDSEAALRHLARAAAAAARPVGILVEVDVGMGRVGVHSPEEALRLARLVPDLGAPLTWEGILFYPGQVRSKLPERMEGIRAASERLGAFLEILESSGLPPKVVSGGSTPTLYESHLFEGVTEIRPGTCIFHDRDMVELGVARPSDVAYWVEASVVSVARPGHLVVDAGSKALSKEEFRGGGAGYGLLPDLPGARLRALSEEHGIIELGLEVEPPEIDSRVRIIPNHVCVSVNLQDRLRVVEGDRAPGWLQLPARGRMPFHGGDDLEGSRL